VSEVKHSDDIRSEAVAEIETVIKTLESVGDDFDNNHDLLGNTGLWAGSARDKCEDVSRAVKKYEEEILPVCVQLKNMLDELNTNVEKFK
jgi:hypothetical protein